MTTAREPSNALFRSDPDIKTLPQSINTLSGLTADSSCYPEQVLQVVLADPPLAAKVMRLANTPYYAFPQQIMSIEQAVSLLGISTLRNLLSGASAFDSVQVCNFSFDICGLWRHSTSAAVAAKLIAKRIRFQQVDKAYTAGLLHDIGKLAVASAAASKFNDIINVVQLENCAMEDAEYKVLGCSHPELGAAVLEDWNLPPATIEAIRFHHHPTHSPSQIHLASIVYLADILAHRSGIGHGGDEMIRELDPVVKRHFHLTESDLAELTAELSFRCRRIDLFSTTSTGDKTEP